MSWKSRLGNLLITETSFLSFKVEIMLPANNKIVHRQLGNFHVVKIFILEENITKDPIRNWNEKREFLVSGHPLLPFGFKSAPSEVPLRTLTRGLL